jgi:hypothetical protein
MNLCQHENTCTTLENPSPTNAPPVYNVSKQHGTFLAALTDLPGEIHYYPTSTTYYKSPEHNQT